MGLGGEVLARLLSIFHAELPEQLDIISGALLHLEAQGTATPAELGACMRAAHNIKGAAHAVGISTIGHIAHRLESVLTALAEGEVSPSSALIDTCLRALDHIRAALVAFEETRPSPFDVEEVLLGLDGLLATDGGAAAGAAPSLPLPPASVPAMTPPEHPSVPPAGGSGEGAGAGETAAMAPDLPRPSGGDDSVRVSVAKLDTLSAIADDLQDTRIGLDCLVAAVRELRGTVLRAGAPGGTVHLHGALDETQAVLRQLGAGLRGRVEELGELIRSLQDGLRSVRMVAVSTIEPHLAQQARSLGRDLDKRVQLRMEGADTEVDRAVLDLLRAPLTHLLRNAIDHGIEPAEQRRVAGKPETGSVTLSIHRQGHQIAVVMADDGRGIDAAAVVDAATRTALLGEDEAARLDHQQVFNLIFHPGFSTRQTVGDISGRGYGLDVVRAAVQRLNGSVHVETSPGQGTVFTLHVPLTLSAEHAVMVRAAGQSFALPVGAVERTLVAGAADMAEIGGGRAVLVDGRAVPLRPLATALGLDAGWRPDPVAGLPMVVLSDGWRSVALAVEQIVGLEEIVIKRLKPPLDDLPGVSGGTLSGRGGIVLALNPRHLVAAALGARCLPSELAAAAERRAPHILVVDDSLTSRALQKNILEYANYRVDAVADGMAGWEALQRGAFDLVVTDVDMPRMDGFQLTEKIKQSERFRDTPVIIVTSLAKDSDRQRGVAVGADAYVVKGQFETRLMLDLVHQLVGE